MSDEVRTTPDHTLVITVERGEMTYARARVRCPGPSAGCGVGGIEDYDCDVEACEDGWTSVDGTHCHTNEGSCGFAAALDGSPEFGDLTTDLTFNVPVQLEWAEGGERIVVSPPEQPLPEGKR